MSTPTIRLAEFAGYLETPGIYTLKGRVYYTSGTGTYYPSNGTRALLVEVVAGGGGGGSVVNAATQAGVGGGGGGGGGYNRKFITSVADSYDYQIGAGGLGGLAGPTANNGATGGSTTFSNTTVGINLIATGGVGGSGLTAAATDSYYNYHTGGTGSGGDTGGLIAGLKGGPRSRGTFSAYVGGLGGASVFGHGDGSQGGSNGDGVDGNRYGAGGGGAATDNITINDRYSGGNGFSGIIIITEYY